VSDPLIGIGTGSLQQTHQAGSNRLDAAALEEIGAVFDYPFDSLGRTVRSAPFAQAEAEVELGGVSGNRLKRSNDAGQFNGRLWRILEGPA